MSVELRLWRTQLSRLLGSWRLSVVLMVAAAMYVALLAIWATSSPPHVVRSIAGLIPYWLVLIGLIANTVVCLWQRLPLLRRGLSPTPVLTRSSPVLSVDTPAGWDTARAATLLGSMGFAARDTGDGRLEGVRGRWHAIAGYLFHGSFLLVVVAIVVSLAARQESRIWVAVGESFEAAPGQVLSRSAPRLGRPVPLEERFTVSSIEPEFWQGRLLFTRLEATLTLADGELATTRINRPLWLGWGTFLRLAGFGYAPRYELLDRAGTVLDSAFVKLNLFPPGQQDVFMPSGFPHRVFVRLLPDAAIEGGQARNRSLDLVAPVFEIRVLRGKVDLGRAALRLGQPRDFEGLILRFPEIAYWGEFSLVRDPGVPLLFLAFALALVGLGLGLGRRRAEVVWVPGEGGRPGRLTGWGAVSPPPALAEAT